MRDSFIEFYGKHNISPVRQDISDLKRHFERREGLYKHLGIAPMFFEGKSVLEIGPGSGHNSIYTASLNPAIYHLVEGNSAGVRQMEMMFQQYNKWTENTTIFPVVLEDYKSEIKYDFVICEGMLPGLNNPVGILLELCNYVKQGGILIITCIDSISGASENLRNLIGQLLTWDIDNVDEMLKVLLPVFSPHLETLSAMSRRHDDWILDNVINPVGVAETLSIARAIEVLGDGFEVYCSSPGIFNDWRWYKSLYGEHKSFNNLAISQYWTQVHNFIDYRKTFLPRDEEDNRKLYNLFDLFRIKTIELREKHDKSGLHEIVSLLGKIIEEVSLISNELSMPFKEVADIIKNDKIDPYIVSQSANFKSFFGRGQQYISFIKR